MLILIAKYRISCTIDLQCLLRFAVLLLSFTTLPVNAAGFSANAGSNQTVYKTSSAVNVNLSATAANSNGGVKRWLWQQISGSKVALNTSINSPNASFSAKTLGNYLFMLTVTDNHGQNAYSVVSITVLNTASKPQLTLLSQSFTANQQLAATGTQTLT